MTTPHRSTPTLLLLLALVAGSLACDPPEDTSSRAERLPLGDPSPDGDEGCVHSHGWWKHHLDWPMPNTVVCDQTWLEILQTPPKGDPWYVLAHQWIGASLNVGSGSPAPADDALIQSEVLLSDCVIDDEELDTALALADQLDDYNNGELGPGHCDDPDDDREDDADDDCGDPDDP